MKFIDEFRDFLKEYKVLSLAVAFVMGGAINSLISSIVNDLFMPLITFFIPGGEWKEAVINIGPVALKWGSALASLINFLVIALTIFIMVKVLNKKK